MYYYRHKDNKNLRNFLFSWGFFQGGRIKIRDRPEPTGFLRQNFDAAAVVDLEDSQAMARHHRIKHSDLPRFIADRMEEWNEVINPTISQVKDCFKGITE